MFSLELVRHGDGETFNTGEIRNIISVIFSRITHYTLPRTRYKNMSVLEKGTLRFYEKPDKCVKYSIDWWIYFIVNLNPVFWWRAGRILHYSRSVYPDPGCHPLTSDASDHSDAVIMTQHNAGTSGPWPGGCPRDTWRGIRSRGLVTWQQPPTSQGCHAVTSLEMRGQSLVNVTW